MPQVKNLKRCWFSNLTAQKWQEKTTSCHSCLFEEDIAD